MTAYNMIFAGFAEEFCKLAAVRKKKKQGRMYQKDTLGDKPWRKGSHFSVFDDPSDIAPPWDRAGANAQHMSPEAENSENDTGNRGV